MTLPEIASCGKDFAKAFSCSIADVNGVKLSLSTSFVGAKVSRQNCKMSAQVVNVFSCWIRLTVVARASVIPRSWRAIFARSPSRFSGRTPSKSSGRSVFGIMQRPHAMRSRADCQEYRETSACENWRQWSASRPQWNWESRRIFLAEFADSGGRSRRAETGSRSKKAMSSSAVKRPFAISKMWRMRLA